MGDYNGCEKFNGRDWCVAGAKGHHGEHRFPPARSTGPGQTAGSAFDAPPQNPWSLEMLRAAAVQSKRSAQVQYLDTIIGIQADVLIDLVDRLAAAEKRLAPEPSGLTSAELEELERLAGAATPGPWTFEPDRDNTGSDPDITHGSIRGSEAGGHYHIARIWGDAGAPDEDARLIAAARNALPRLIAEIRRLRKLETNHG